MPLIEGALNRASDLVGPWVQMRRCGAPAPLRLDGTNKRSVLRLCLHQNRNVGVGVFPEREEILVRTHCLDLVPRESECSTQLQMCQYTNRIRADEPPMCTHSS